jgi:hypothetical protein
MSWKTRQSRQVADAKSSADRRLGLTGSAYLPRFRLFFVVLVLVFVAVFAVVLRVVIEVVVVFIVAVVETETEHKLVAPMKRVR